MTGLTAKQESACLKYIECGNKSEAYRHAYNTENMKPETINKRAYELFDTGAITGRVEELRSAIQKRTEVTVDAVVKELALLGFANMMDYVRISDDGEPFIDLSDLTREQAAAISETMVEDYVEGRGEDARQVRKVRLKFHDKKGALTKLGEYLGMFTQKVEHSGPGGGPIPTDDLSKLTNEELEERLRILRGG